MTFPSTSRPTLVFDWGNTLMLEIPGCDGPMVEWPQVAALPGAQSALAQLCGPYRLVLATNARASSAAQVRAALDRVGLAGTIETIFTAAELNGNRKPAAAFFRVLEGALGIRPENAVMIGDSFTDDVLGAASAGWRSVWLNPQRSPAPGLTPPHDAQIATLDELPAALAATLARPTLAQAETWLLEHNNPYNILTHVRGVAAVAYRFALWLQAAGHPVDPILTHRAALLHDIRKLPAPSDEPNLNHAERGARLLEARGMPDLAEIVRRHRLFSILQSDAPRTWEEKLVYFCDKLVNGAGLVPVEERLADLKRRHAIVSPDFPRVQAAVRALQDELCAAADFPSDQLIPRLTAALSGLPE